MYLVTNETIVVGVYLTAWKPEVRNAAHTAKNIKIRKNFT